MTPTVRRAFFLGPMPLALAMAAQAAFGTYYAWSEHQRGAYFDPFQSTSAFVQTVVEPAARSQTPGGDVEAYVKAAHSFATRGNYTLDTGLASAWVTPGYPLLLALFFKIVGQNFWAILALNTLAWGIALLATLELCAALSFTRFQSLLTFVLFSGNLRLSMFVGYAYTECVFIAAATLTLALVVKLVQSPALPPRSKLRLAAALGITAGLGALVRPIMLGAFLPLVVVGGVHAWRSPASDRRSSVVAWILAGAVALLPTEAWILRNAAALGHPEISTSSALARAEGNQDFYLTRPLIGVFKSAPIQYPFNPVPNDTFSPHPELNLYQAAKVWAKRWSEQHTLGEHAYVITQRVTALLSPYTEDLSVRNRLISSLIWLLIFPFAIVGFRTRWASDQKFSSALLGATALLLIILPAGVVVGPSLRYQVPGEILLTPLAALGLHAAGSALIRRWRPEQITRGNTG